MKNGSLEMGAHSGTLRERLLSGGSHSKLILQWVSSKIFTEIRMQQQWQPRS